MTAIGQAISSVGSWVYEQVTGGFSTITSSISSCARPIFSGIFSLIFCQNFWAERSVERRDSPLGSGQLPAPRGGGRLEERRIEVERRDSSLGSGEPLDLRGSGRLESEKEEEEENFQDLHDRILAEELQREEESKAPDFDQQPPISETERQALAERLLAFLLADQSDQTRKEIEEVVLLIKTLSPEDQQAIETHCTNVLPREQMEAIFTNKAKITEDHELIAEQNQEFEEGQRVDQAARANEQRLLEASQKWQTQAKAVLHEITVSNEENKKLISLLEGIEIRVVRIAQKIERNPEQKTERNLEQKDVDNLEGRVKDPLGLQLLNGLLIPTENFYQEGFQSLQAQFSGLEAFIPQELMPSLEKQYGLYCTNLQRLKTLLAVRDEWLEIKKKVLERNS